MEPQAVLEEVLNQQPSADCYKQEQEQVTKKTRLTMKYLYELIRGLQRENFMLSQRVDELEQGFAGFRTYEEEAAAGEAPELQDLQELEESYEEVPESEDELQEVQKLYKVNGLQEESLIAVLAEVLEPHPKPDILQPICVPRSERHQRPKRNSFWPFRSHHRTILR